VHRFTLNRAVSGPLNSSLGAWCERKAEAATEYERLVQASLPPELADMALRVRRAGSAAGVQLSNQGGFQSYHDLFTEQVGKKRKHSYRHCRKLHALFSAAMDQVVGEIPRGSSSHDGRPAHELHEAVAWCNVNSDEDSNSIHVHDRKRWSAVYFVSEGEPNAPGFPNPLGGHLVFRCGPRSDVSSAGDDASHVEHHHTHARRASQTYFAVHPVPGSFWIFPGSIPHLVLGSTLPAGVTKALSRRISIAINCVDATPSPPTDHGSAAGPGKEAANLRLTDLIISRDDVVTSALSGQTRAAANAVREGRALISEV